MHHQKVEMTQGCGGMAKEDFREKIEKHRQPIQLNEEQDVSTRKSRMEKRGKSTNKNNKQANTTKTKSPFITVLLALLLLIPSSAFIYVYFWEPTSETGTEVVQDEKVVEVETNDVGTTSDANTTVTDEPTQTQQTTEQTNNQQTNSPSQQTPTQQGEQMYTVEKNDNLYNISVKYYGDGSGIDKIKEANGLTSESIAVGQTLIIPE